MPSADRGLHDPAEIPPTVFIVDDDPSVRRSLEALVRSTGLACQAYASGTEFLEACPSDRPGCVVLDLRLRGEDGLAVQEELVRRGIRLPVIFLTAYGTIGKSVRAMKAGAVDFLKKPTAPRELLGLIRQAAERSRCDLTAERERDAIRRRFERLTPRQRQVTEGLIEGKTSKEIAADLGTSVRTVEGHRRAVLEKMRVSSAAALVREVLSVRTVEAAPLR